jgi:hypothetical protein
MWSMNHYQINYILSALPGGVLAYQNLNLGIFWRDFEWKMSVFFIHSEYLRPFSVFYGQLVYFVVVWYTLYQEKSGNPDDILGTTFQCAQQSCGQTNCRHFQRRQIIGISNCRLYHI